MNLKNLTMILLKFGEMEKLGEDLCMLKDLVDFIYFSIANFDKIPLTLNVGMGFDYSINEYYKTIAEVVGYNGKFKHDLSKPVGMKRKLVDISKLEELGGEVLPH